MLFILPFSMCLIAPFVFSLACLFTPLCFFLSCLVASFPNVSCMGATTHMRSYVDDVAMLIVRGPDKGGSQERDSRVPFQDTSLFG